MKESIKNERLFGLCVQWVGKHDCVTYQLMDADERTDQPTNMISFKPALAQCPNILTVVNDNLSIPFFFYKGSVQ